MALACSMPPPMPAACTSASFSIGIRSDVAGEELDGAARGLFEGRDAGVAVLMEDPGLRAARRLRAPKWRDANCATPMLFSHVAMGTRCFQCVMRRPSPRSISSSSAPFATTW